MKSKWLTAAAMAVLLSASAPAFAGPVADFEAQARAVYANYRAALFQTNKNDKAATLDALKALSGGWSALATKWSAAPPQYGDDPAYAGTLKSVASIIDTATSEANAGNLAHSHETLEKIRDELGALRSRNGVTIFSDRMNAYHAKMEGVLGDKYDAFSVAGLGKLREDAAVLAYLYDDLAAKPPADGAGKPDYAQALAAVKASIDAVLTAARAGDATAAKKAVDGLKGPYSMLFLKFG